MTDPLARLAQMDPHLFKRIVVNDNGCWVYSGRPTTAGHCQVKRNGVRMQVHRRTYQLLIDESLEIRPGSGCDDQLDHVCRNRACCNPWHLRLVTARENGLLGANGIAGTHRSPYVGVTWNARARKWQASIAVLRHSYHLGVFADEAVAAATYDAASILLNLLPANRRYSRLDRDPSADEFAMAREHLARRHVLPQ